jgi:hypothetical protein
MSVSKDLENARAKLAGAEAALLDAERERDEPVIKAKAALADAQQRVEELEREAAEQETAAKRKQADELRAELRDRTAELNAALDELAGRYARTTISESKLYALDGTRPTAGDALLAGLVSRGILSSRDLTVNATVLRRLSEDPAERERRAADQRAADGEQRERERPARLREALGDVERRIANHSPALTNAAERLLASLQQERARLLAELERESVVIEAPAEFDESAVRVGD